MTGPSTVPSEDDALNALQIARIEEGIAAADRGDFATEEEMEAIFNKYASPPTNQI